MTRERFLRAGPVPLSGPGLVRPGTGHPRRGQHRRRDDVGRRRRSPPPTRRTPSPGAPGPTSGRRPPARLELLARATDADGSQPVERSGTGRAWRTTSSSGCRSPCWADRASSLGLSARARGLDDDRPQPGPQGERQRERRPWRGRPRGWRSSRRSSPGLLAVVDQAHDDQDDAVEADQRRDDVADVEGAGGVPAAGLRSLRCRLIGCAPGSAEDDVQDDDHDQRDAGQLRRRPVPGQQVRLRVGPLLLRRLGVDQPGQLATPAWAAVTR